MSTVFAKNVNWRFAQAQKLGFVEKVKSGANFLTLIDIGVKKYYNLLYTTKNTTNLILKNYIEGKNFKIKEETT